MMIRSFLAATFPLLAATFPLLAAAPAAARAGAPEVTWLATPAGGIQPVAEIDPAGNLHLIYFRGDDVAHGDLFYCVRRKGSEGFGNPVRINSTDGSAIAIGTVRGAQLALGRGGLVHVAWMGSSQVTPEGDHHRAPMLYARSTDGGKTFEPERNLITKSFGLDGGGALAADASGRVEVFWHAGERGAGETARKVWVTRSANDGETFAPEVAAWATETGACGCCGMTAGAAAGKSFVLYRAATAGVHRDIYLLASDGRQFTGQKLDEWELPSCPMSAMSLGFSGATAAAAWEAQGGDLAFAIVGTAISGRVAHGTAARKFPDIALSPDGHVLLAWIDGAGWKKAGRPAWQMFSPDGRPIGTPTMRPADAAVWTKPAVVFDGASFVVLY